MPEIACAIPVNNNHGDRGGMHIIKIVCLLWITNSTASHTRWMRQSNGSAGGRFGLYHFRLAGTVAGTQIDGFGNHIRGFVLSFMVGSHNDLAQEAHGDKLDS